LHRGAAPHLRIKRSWVLLRGGAAQEWNLPHTGKYRHRQAYLRLERASVIFLTKLWRDSDDQSLGGAVSGPFDNSEHWLKLADESRVAATHMSDPFSKRTLLLIAQRYEIMAERAGQRAAQEASRKKA
jgi:hypothetical protein